MAVFDKNYDLFGGPVAVTAAKTDAKPIELKGGYKSYLGAKVPESDSPNGDMRLYVTVYKTATAIAGESATCSISVKSSDQAAGTYTEIASIALTPTTKADREGVLGEAALPMRMGRFVKAEVAVGDTTPTAGSVVAFLHVRDAV